MRTVIFAIAVLVVFLAVFAQYTLAEESYFKKYIHTLQEFSADAFAKASDTLTQVKESQFGQKVEHFFDVGTDYIRSAYDTVKDTAHAKWEAITS